jgi:hypothetical protein
MLGTCLIDPAATTDGSPVDKLSVPLIDALPLEPGFAPGDSSLFEPQYQKTDAEAVQDWESEGGASTHSSED